MKKEKSILIGVLIFVISLILDRTFLQITQKVRFNPLNKLFIFLGGKIGLIIFVILITIILFYKKRNIFLFWVSVILAGSISYIIKSIIARPRPTLYPLIIKTSASFPSTHATIAGVCAYFTYKLKNQKLKWTGLILSFLVAATGFYNSVHYISDIVSGVLLGMLISVLVLKKK